MQNSGIIYSHDWDQPRPAASETPSISKSTRSTGGKNSTSDEPNVQGQALYVTSWTQLLGLGIVAVALGGLTGPLTPRIQLEAKYATLRAQAIVQQTNKGTQKQPVTKQSPVTPAIFSPLTTPDGASIDPVNKEFSLVIPKIGINAAVIPAVNPNKPGEYLAALKKGVAHSSLSYLPDEDGTVYLFSHSTNYEWFVNDLNAVFYLLKNLEEKDTVILFYKGFAYTYQITGKQIVKPTEVTYLTPQKGPRRLILQTCWPPGSTTERLLLFADLIEDPTTKI